VSRVHAHRDSRGRPAAYAPGTDPLVTFLVDRLTEDLALLWSRDEARGDAHRPGLPAQVAVLDELLAALQAGRLPSRADLRIVLFGYGAHPDYDPAWTDRLG
jgi:hypothetical protein